MVPINYNKYVLLYFIKCIIIVFFYKYKPKTYKTISTQTENIQQELLEISEFVVISTPVRHLV